MIRLLMTLPDQGAIALGLTLAVATALVGAAALFVLPAVVNFLLP